MKTLTRNQPCGCVICRCEDEERCHGCGAKNCGNHPAGMIPNPSYVQASSLTERTTAAIAWIDAQLAICKAASNKNWIISGSKDSVICPNEYGFVAKEDVCVKPKLDQFWLRNAAFIAAARTGYPAVLEGMKVVIPLFEGVCFDKALESILTKIEKLQ